MQLTGCASRNIGVITGVLLIVAALFPKSWSLLIGIPAPVTAIFIVATLSPLMVEGMKMIVQDAPDNRMGLVIGSALLIGLGFQTGLVPLPIGDIWESLSQRSLTAGGVTLVLLLILAEFNRGRRRTLRTELNVDALPQVNRFLEDLSRSRGWESRMTGRLQAVAEETLITLSHAQDDTRAGTGRLILSVGGDGSAAEMEFVSAAADTRNLEDCIALLANPGPQAEGLGVGESESAIGRDASLRLLRHYATSVTHRQYHDIEVIEVRVVSPASG